MSTRLLNRIGVHVLGTFGLLLIVLVGKVAPHTTPRNPTSPARVRAWLARRALDGIGAIGWLVDHLSPPVSSGRSEPKLTGGRIGAKPA